MIHQLNTNTDTARMHTHTHKHKHRHKTTDTYTIATVQHNGISLLTSCGGTSNDTVLRSTF